MGRVRSPAPSPNRGAILSEVRSASPSRQMNKAFLPAQSHAPRVMNSAVTTQTKSNFPSDRTNVEPNRAHSATPIQTGIAVPSSYSAETPNTEHTQFPSTARSSLPSQQISGTPIEAPSTAPMEIGLAVPTRKIITVTFATAGKFGAQYQSLCFAHAD